MMPARVCLAPRKLEGLLRAHAMSLQQAALQLEERVILRQSHLRGRSNVTGFEQPYAASGHQSPQASPHGTVAMHLAVCHLQVPART